VRDPEILLMDEPTSALDLQRQIELLGIVRDLARTRGVLAEGVLAHSPALSERPPRIL